MAISASIGALAHIGAGAGAPRLIGASSGYGDSRQRRGRTEMGAETGTDPDYSPRVTAAKAILPSFQGASNSSNA